MTDLNSSLTDEDRYNILLLQCYFRTLFRIWWLRTKTVGLDWVKRFTMLFYALALFFNFLGHGSESPVLEILLRPLLFIVQFDVILFFLAYPLSWLWSVFHRIAFVPTALLSFRGAWNLYVIGRRDYSGDLTVLREVSRIEAQEKLLAELGIKSA